MLGVGIGIGIGSGLGLGLGLASRHDIVGRPAPFGEHEPPPPRHRCRRRLRQVPSQPALPPSRAPTHVHTFMCAHRRFASSAGLSRANIPTLQTRTTSSATSRRRACTATLPTCVRACGPHSRMRSPAPGCAEVCMLTHRSVAPRHTPSGPDGEHRRGYAAGGGGCRDHDAAPQARGLCPHAPG